VVSRASALGPLGTGERRPQRPRRPCWPAGCARDRARRSIDVDLGLQGRRGNCAI